MQKKILIIQTAFPGDAILTLPLIQEIKKTYTNAIISVLCIPSTKIIFEHSKSVDRVVVYDKKEKQKSLKDFLKLIYTLRKERYDIVISPHRSLRSGLIAYFSSSKSRIGFSNSACKYLYNKRIEYISTEHEVKRNLNLLEKDYQKWNNIFPEISIPDKILQNIQKILETHRANDFIAIASGSVWETKKYPVKYWIEVINYLNTIGYTIILLGGDSDKEILKCIEKKDNIISLIGKLSIVESIGILKKARLLIANDSAPTHMGMIAGIPVLTIYCSTVPEFGFYPYNMNSSCVGIKIDCKPCGIHGYKKCPQNHFNCGNKLFSSLIIDKINEILNI